MRGVRWELKNVLALLAPLSYPLIANLLTYPPSITRSIHFLNSAANTSTFGGYIIVR